MVMPVEIEEVLSMWTDIPLVKMETLSSFGDANCMEQLLVHCATAIETNDATLAQQILWVLNIIAPPDGNSSQRLTSAFLRALIARAARSGSCKLLTAVANVNAVDLSTTNHKFSIIELVGYVNLTYEELGLKIVNFAKSQNVAMEFREILSSSSEGFSSLIEQLRAIGTGAGGEALIINCQMMLHYIPGETRANASNSLRTIFLKAVRGLNSKAVVVVDEDANLMSGNLMSRLRAAYNYLGIPYDTVETFLLPESRQQQWYDQGLILEGPMCTLTP
ncbi:scarecrow-like protein 32 [Salvia miltiorrhiza]|uniref:scarecrow-like protein 32 n=1 Tax=Salvia miltiorrhiza TaxID=226208 RepID=UPI0025ABE8A4|nr:scarecrow-like protein 32 [Salvia miltiorrhiza]